MIERLIKEQTDNTLIQLLRYSFTGTIAIVVDFYFLFLFTELFNIHYLISAAIAYLTGIFVNYILSTAWVFNKRTDRNFYLDFILFTLVGIIGLGMLEVFMWVFTDTINFHYMFSKLFASMLVSLWNFFARKHILENI